MRNKLGARSQRELGALERCTVFTAHLALPETRFERTFDLPHLQNIHRALFGDVYDWAGQLRTVNISRGTTHFLPHTHLHLGAEHAFTKLRHESALLNPQVDDEAFVAGAAELLSDLNFLHPFRDGNGRTQRAFLDDVAAVSGHRLTWANVDATAHAAASEQTATTGDPTAFLPIIQAALNDPKNEQHGPLGVPHT